MLDILRKNASSWITKLILGIIAVSFALFYGWNSLHKVPGAPETEVAEVNGEPILFQEFSQRYQNQLNTYEQIYKSKLPDPLRNQLQQMALNSLIQERIIRQAAEKIGLKVTDAEVRDTIVNNPNLQVNGKFDPNQYKNVFRPWFLNHNGIDYEDALRSDKLKEKFIKQFEGTLFVSDLSLRQQFTVENTKMALKMVSLSPDDLAKDYKEDPQALQKKMDSLKQQGTSNEEDLKQQASEALKAEYGLSKANKLADELWPLWSAGKPTETLIKQMGLKVTDIPATPLSQTNTFFKGEDDPQAVSTLFSLTKNKPYTDKPLRVGDSIYLIQLTSRTDPDPNDFEKNKSSLKSQAQREISRQYFQAWYQQALTQAKVKILKTGLGNDTGTS